MPDDARPTWPPCGASLLGMILTDDQISELCRVLEVWPRMPAPA